MRIIIIVLLSTLFASQTHSESSAQPQIGPSFDCGKASTKIETEICSDPFLSFLDLYLSDIYKTSLEEDPENAENLKKTQRDWLKKARNDLCLKGDFSWSSSADDARGIDAVSTTNLEKCYILRTAEINQDFCSTEVLCNKYKSILSKFHKIPRLMSAIGSNEESFLREYGEKFDSQKNMDPAEKYLLDKYSESVLYDLFPQCFGVRPSIYYRDDNFFIVQYFGSTVCGGTSHTSNEKENLCIQKESVVAVDNYWQCKGKNDAKSIWQALTPIIKTTNFSESIENFRSYDSQSSFQSTPESYLISTITSLPFLVYNHPSLYSKETMDWIDSNHNLIMKILGGHKENALTILRDAKYMYASISKEENWQHQLTSIVENDERRFLGFDVDDKRIMNTNVIGTIYTLHDIYVLVWARVYKHGDIQKTINTIEKLIITIETQKITIRTMKFKDYFLT